MSSPDVKSPADTAPLQHLQHRLVLSHHSHATVHGTGTIARFNTWLAVIITRSVGTMWVAYIFAIIALISLPAAIQSGSVIVIIAWIAQTFFQLVLLPIIIVGQNVIQATNDARAEADHETLTAVHKLTIEVHEINEAQSAILRQLQATGA
jgi:dolichyl-phosphate-mannose--protein O-mannosyl transferase